MMYYVSVYTRKAVSDLQKKLVETAEEWQGTLVNGDDARKKCVERFQMLVARYNKEFSMYKSCRLAESENGFCIEVADVYEYTFINVTFNKVQSNYDGITHWRI